MPASPTSGFRVRIAPLSDGLHTETLTPSADDLGLDPSVFSNLAVDVTLDVRDRRVRAAFTARATAHLECDRTLDLYDEPVEGAHEVLFVPPVAAMADAADDESVQVLPVDVTHVDLAGPVRDTLLLALPLRRVSPAARDLPIATAFGGSGDDDPADDRWDALRALRHDSDTADRSGDGSSV